MAADVPATQVVVNAVGPVTPQNQALLEAGKALLNSSIGTGSDFCKYMITLSTGAIPVFLGIIKAVIPQNYVPVGREAKLIVASGICFIVASAIFAWAYYPRVAQLSLDVPSSVEDAMRKIINERRWFALAGFLVFLAGTIMAIVTVVFALQRGAQDLTLFTS